MTIELTIRAETTDELKEELARLLLANLQAVPSPILPSDASVRQALNQVYDRDPVQGGPKVQSPDDRQRLRDAAERAREEHLVARQAAQNSVQAGDPSPVQSVQAANAPPAPRKRGRPPTTAQAPAPGNGTEATTRPATEPGEDLSGDPEEGDHTHAPEDEPADMLRPEAPARTRTPAEKRNALLPVLSEVHKLDKQAVPALCARYHAARVSLIADEHTDALWADARALCRKHSVAFVSEDVL
jgi:hypothetical protein